MALVQFGNEAVLEPYKPNPETNETKTRKVKGSKITTMSLVTQDVGEAINTAKALWQNDSEKAPAWVESDDEVLQAALAQTFDCREGRPQSWKETD